MRSKRCFSHNNQIETRVRQEIFDDFICLALLATVTSSVLDYCIGWSEALLTTRDKVKRSV